MVSVSLKISVNEVLFNLHACILAWHNMPQPREQWMVADTRRSWPSNSLHARIFSAVQSSTLS